MTTPRNLVLDLLNGGHVEIRGRKFTAQDAIKWRESSSSPVMDSGDIFKYLCVHPYDIELERGSLRIYLKAVIEEWLEDAADGNKVMFEWQRQQEESLREEA